MDYTVLARIQSLVAEMESVKAELIGMEAHNTCCARAERCKAHTFLDIAYTESAFQDKAKQLQGIATELQQLSR